MSSSHQASPEPLPDAIAGGAAPATPAEIDASCRWPVAVLLAFAACWLVGGGVLSLLAAIKLHAPGMLATHPFATYGRLQPAAWNGLVFGFAVQAGLAVSAWLTARLGRTPLVGGRGIILAALFWNLALKIGVLGILAGNSTGVEGLELPTYASVILFAAYIGIAGWILLTFKERRAPELYVSQWYLLGALCTFPWLYGGAQSMAVFVPLRGVLQAAAQAWFFNGFLVFWFGFLSLAVLFYLIPKSTGRAIRSRSLAVFGFWSLAAFGGFGGLARYWGGPFPAYMLAVGVVGTVLTVFPLLANLGLLYPALRPQPGGDPKTVPARFALLSFASYAVYGLLNIANAFTPVRRTTQLTMVGLGLDQLMLWGCFGSAVLGAIYFLVPRLAGRAWPHPRLAGFHLGCVVVAVGLVTVAFLAGGVVQGEGMNDLSQPFFMVMRRYIPFASTGTLAQLVFLAGALALAVNAFSLLVLGVRETAVTGWRNCFRADAPAVEVKA